MNLQQLSTVLLPNETLDVFLAKAVAREVEARTTLTFHEALELYRKAGRATRYMDRIEAYWTNTPVKDMSPAAIRQCSIDLFPDAQGATRNRQVITPTAAVINLAAEYNRCRPIVVRRFPIARKRPTPIDWPWVETFMREANPKLGALAVFMFLTAARISEALAVTWTDINLVKSTARIVQRKNHGTERHAHLPEILIEALQRLEPDGDLVFGYASRHSVKDAWHRCIDRAGLPRLSFHACRHGFATSLIQAGVDPITVADLGGWATPDLVFTTYGHARTDKTIPDALVEVARR